MNHVLRQRMMVFLGLVLAAWLLCAGSAHAQITCSGVTLSGVNFGAVNPLASQTTANGTLNYTCTNASKNKTHSATICFNLGEPAGGQTNPRLMANGSNKLQFQLYQDPAYTTVWGSSGFGSFRTPLVVNIAGLPGRGTQTGSATMYGQVLAGQNTIVPGAYIDTYGSGDFLMVINDVSGDTPPGTCTTGTSSSNPVSSFIVSATASAQCTVAAGISPINLGTVAPTATNISGNTSISIACSNTTPYYIGLLPSNGNTTGAGVMSGTGGNTDKVPYQLYSDAGLTTKWGNTATATSVGNGVKGTGTGSAQSTTVYARAASADFSADTYTDTVTVTVNY